MAVSYVLWITQSRYLDWVLVYFEMHYLITYWAAKSIPQLLQISARVKSIGVVKLTYLEKSVPQCHWLYSEFWVMQHKCVYKYCKFRIMRCRQYDPYWSFDIPYQGNNFLVGSHDATEYHLPHSGVLEADHFPELLQHHQDVWHSVVVPHL